MKSKPGIMFYFDVWHVIETLPESEQLLMLKGIFHYGEWGEVPQLPDKLALAWEMFRTRLDADQERYENRVRKSREAAEKRWSKEKGCQGMPFMPSMPTTTTSSPSTAAQSSANAVEGEEKKEKQNKEKKALPPKAAEPSEIRWERGLIPLEAQETFHGIVGEDWKSEKWQALCQKPEPPGQ